MNRGGSFTRRAAPCREGVDKQIERFYHQLEGPYTRGCYGRGTHDARCVPPTGYPTGRALGGASREELLRHVLIVSPAPLVPPPYLFPPLAAAPLPAATGVFAAT